MLRETYPDMYEQYMGKYAGREYIPRQRIPTLDCLWSDVLHFSAVDPGEIKQALMEAGYSSDVAMQYYRVDPRLIESKHAIVYLYAYEDRRDVMNEKNIVPYNPFDIAQYSVIPQATKDYYKEMSKKKERPLLYHKIPHVLYRGTLDISHAEVVSV